jgi:hypothetical protein
MAATSVAAIPGAPHNAAVNYLYAIMSAYRRSGAVAMRRASVCGSRSRLCRLAAPRAAYENMPSASSTIVCASKAGGGVAAEGAGAGSGRLDSLRRVRFATGTGTAVTRERAATGHLSERAQLTMDLRVNRRVREQHIDLLK